MEFSHEPVLTKEVVELLNPSPGCTLVDATVGGGGHSKVLLQHLGKTGRLIGIDRDPEALEAAREELAPFQDQVTLLKGNFGTIDRLLQDIGVKAVDGILFDLGVSSHQLDVPGRGFSYQHDAPLDMRMDPDQELTAADLVNNAPRDELTRIIREFGEERWASRIAEFIVERRAAERLVSTGQLVEVIKAAIPASARRRGPHPARRTFQALRIATNAELDSLKEGLAGAVESLHPGGRLCVISFHSLEDRIVKQEFRYLEKDCICPPGLPVCRCDKVRQVQILTRSPVTPGPDEQKRNPRARSARLRAAEKV